MKNDWTVLYCNSIEEMEELILDKPFVWPLIINGIREMLIERRTSVIILEGKLIGTGKKDTATVWITISDTDVEASLSKMLAWREDREEYEECSQIVSLLNEWKSRECAVECAD